MLSNFSVNTKNWSRDKFTCDYKLAMVKEVCYCITNYSESVYSYLIHCCHATFVRSSAGQRADDRAAERERVIIELSRPELQPPPPLCTHTDTHRRRAHASARRGEAAGCSAVAVEILRARQLTVNARHAAGVLGIKVGNTAARRARLPPSHLADARLGYGSHTITLTHRHTHWDASAYVRDQSVKVDRVIAVSARAL